MLDLATASSADSEEIRLTPAGVLQLFSSSPNHLGPLATLHRCFAENWCCGWFHMAADKLSLIGRNSLTFWQMIANEYLTQLCHIPEESEFSPLDPPDGESLNVWLLKAPPMIGGEYLNQKRLEILWHDLNLWVVDATRQYGGIHLFLQKRAPKWHHVGRVCFHLAENKNDPNRPFAFLATYSTGFSQNGRLKHLPLKRALEQYSGENNRAALIKLLTPVQQAAGRCAWVKDLVNTASLYQPLAWAANMAYKFLLTVPELESSGLSVRIPNWWKQRKRPQVAVTIGSKTQSFLGADAMLDFNVEVALGDQLLTPEELKAISSSSQGIVYIRGQWIEVDNEKLQQALHHWKNVQQHTKNGEVSFFEGMRLLAGAPSSLEEDERWTGERSWTSVTAGQQLAELLRALKDPSQLPTQKTLTSLNATLRPYQREGIRWLSLLSGLGLGACLADDMGLGKTLQALALLLIQQSKQRKNRYPSLLVAPASLLGNWRQEAQRFTPSIKLLFVHPSETSPQALKKIAKEPEAYLNDYDLVITTYSMVIRQNWIKEIPWDLLILDEAQAIKNPTTKQCKAIKTLKSRARIALTGTPIENRLSELWSLFDFLNPGLLGSFARFKEYIKTLQEGPEQFESLRKLVSPYILRRMKTDPKIISDLPEKIETPTYCQLTKLQAQHYKSIVDQLAKNLASVDPKNRRGIVLQSLMRLKQVCNHPAQLQGVGEYLSSQSGKFQRLEQICEELAARQEKVLIFSQFKEIIDPIANHLTDVFNCPGLVLHGDTPIRQRKQLVEKFQKEDGPPFFVLSLKAGGTGLTLTSASHVIHFDRWWNPAVENQATDRAYRIGQKKNVQVHKFITQGTVEEVIDKMIESKKGLADQILNNTDEVKITELSDEELLNLVSLDINRAQMF